MKRSNYRFLGLVLAIGGLGLVSSCGDDNNPLGGDGGFVPPDVGGAVKAIAKTCGIDVDCEAGGIAKGNASISGVASVDAIFQSVINFQAKVDNVSADIDAQVAAIKGDFGIAAEGKLGAELKAQIDANVEGGLKIVAEPAQCKADVQASLDAKARCEGKVDPGMVSVECKGGCEVEASAMASCSGSAMLKCTVNSPSVKCMGECSGSCEVPMVKAECSGECTGTCSGACSAYSDSGKTMCAGKCDGMCEGSCKTEVSGDAGCMGTCTGECKVDAPSGGCEGAIRASCEAEANASVMCEGRCDGEVTPPMVKAECEASVKAEAKMNVECTPPRVSIDYELKAGANAEAQAKFVAGVENLKVRLPALLASIKGAASIGDAGADLVADAGAQINTVAKGSAMVIADGDLKAGFGLICAAKEAGKIPGALTDSADRLQGSLSAAAEVTGAIGLK